MKKFNIATGTNQLFGLNLEIGDIYGCIPISTMHMKNLSMYTIDHRENGERNMLYVIRDRTVHVLNYFNKQYKYFTAYYAEKPIVSKGTNPQSVKVRWQKGQLIGSMLLEKLNNCIMQYCIKFGEKIISIKPSNDVVRFGSDKATNGMPLPTRKEHQQGFIYKSAPKQCNPWMTKPDSDILPRIPHVKPMYHKDKPMYKATQAKNRDMIAWQTEQRSKGLPCTEEDYWKYVDSNK